MGWKEEAMSATPLRERPWWQALEKHHAEIGEQHLRELFAQDPHTRRATVRAGGWPVSGLSQNRVTDQILL